MPRASLVRPLVALATATLLTACGSTVQYSQTVGQGPAGDGLAAPGGSSGELGTTTGAVGSGASSTTGTGVAGGSTGTGSGGVGTSTGAQTTGSSGGPTTIAGAETGRGFTRSVIRLGVGTANDFNSFAGKTGLSGVTYNGDPMTWMRAVAAEINKHGGLLGRRVELVPHDFNTAQELTDTARANQQACTTWTQDKPVFAVLPAGFLVEDTLLTCLDKAQTPLVFPGASVDYPLHYQRSYDKFPLFFNLAQMVGEQYDRLSIDRLVARGFFTPWDNVNGKPATSAKPVKIGLIGFSDNDGAVQLASQQKELARHGLKADFTIACPRSLNDKVACEQSAVLRFASNGITHVTGADTTFMKNADSQSYRPRYWIQNSASAFAANVSSSQLNGAMSEGYVPTYDVDRTDAPKESAATARCKAIMKAAGQAATDNTTVALQLSVCDEFFFTAAAIAKAGALSPAAFRIGMERLGASVPSALTFQTFLGPRRHASAAVARDLIYRSDLKRFVYASSTNYGSGS